MLIVAGKPLRGSERVLDWHATGLAFAPPYKGCRARTQPCTLGVGHWTGGEAGTMTSADDGKRVYDVLKNRTNEAGKPTPLSVHFCVGYDGTIWQYADPAAVVCLHAGAVNDFSWGVEIVNRGLPPDQGRGREEVAHKVHGRLVKQLAFTQSQLDSWLWLCDAVQGALGLPRAVPAGPLEPVSDRIADAKLRAFRGVVEHLHASSSKVDGGTQLVRHLLSAGYARVQP